MGALCSLLLYLKTRRLRLLAPGPQLEGEEWGFLAPNGKLFINTRLPSKYAWGQDTLRPAKGQPAFGVGATELKLKQLLSILPLTTITDNKS